MGVTRIPLNGIHAASCSRQLPADPAGSRLQGRNQRLQPHLVQGDDDAERRHGPVPRVPHGDGNPPGVRVHDAGQLGKAVAGRLLEQRAELLGRTLPAGSWNCWRYAAWTGGGWLAISASPAEDTCTGIRPAIWARLATEPRRESRSTNSASQPSSTARFTFWFSTCWMSSMNGMAAWRRARVGEFRLTSSHRRRPSRTDPAAAQFQQPVPGQLPDQPVGGAQRQCRPVRELGERQHGDALGER